MIIIIFISRPVSGAFNDNYLKIKAADLKFLKFVIHFVLFLILETITYLLFPLNASVFSPFSSLSCELLISYGHQFYAH